MSSSPPVIPCIPRVRSSEPRQPPNPGYGLALLRIVALSILIPCRPRVCIPLHALGQPSRPDSPPFHHALPATPSIAQAFTSARMMAPPPRQPRLDCFTRRYCYHLVTCNALVTLPVLRPTVRPVFVPQASMAACSRSRSATLRSAVVGKGRASGRAGRSGTGWGWVLWGLVDASWWDRDGVCACCVQYSPACICLVGELGGPVVQRSGMFGIR